MAGRLEKYNDFIQKTQYTIDEKKPLKKSDTKQVQKKLKSSNMNLIINESKQKKLIVCAFYSKQGKKVYRFVVFPKKQLLKKSKKYIEIIDVKTLTRKIFRRDRIIKLNLTEKVFSANQDAIGYKK